MYTWLFFVHRNSDPAISIGDHARDTPPRLRLYPFIVVECTTRSLDDDDRRVSVSVCIIDDGCGIVIKYSLVYVHVTGNDQLNSIFDKQRINGCK
jgi:hypothetical protein